jgi:hypothetical protein
LNHIAQSDALEDPIVPIIERGKCSNWSNFGESHQSASATM